MSKYPALFSPDADGGYVVTFRDIPEAITQGDTLAEAEQAAADALLTAMDFYFEDQRPVPPPSALQPGEAWVALPLSVAAKVALLNELCRQQLRPAELARAMGVRPQEVTRLLDLSHATKIDTIGRAFSAIGKDLALVVS
ncbi:MULTISPECIES: type II toxin-antitoxin system HicB family antitoxin [unclassified Rubrivivax]|uniref:type II toxin-antitoxin system HicB family antitoxin n=1 Tax=unclassified Rubrivivax TaxID=2649762 RepID=UPI001E3D6068|nr:MULTISPECIES: type II toxin-antitoxin system HicB family antitoxin [unclassified Rubrivivax]MCC9595207.1 type II toxin-antitoxin system HicB family antitoxin [Rubrivivax sp. JA1055]MCC9648000.1 type II toxin-antitoxin system HicB family antitoxin [Rubrivivax sp. JA1029]